MSTTDDQLSAISAQLQTFLATLDNSVNWQILFLAGSTDDPDSFDANGGKTGALGYYPVVNISGQTVYMPCLARMKAIALGGANAETLDAILGTATSKIAAIDLAKQAAEDATAATTAAKETAIAVTEDAAAASELARNQAAAAQIAAANADTVGDLRTFFTRVGPASGLTGKARWRIGNRLYASLDAANGFYPRKLTLPVTTTFEDGSAVRSRLMAANTSDKIRALPHELGVGARWRIGNRLYASLDAADGFYPRKLTLPVSARFNDGSVLYGRLVGANTGDKIKALAPELGAGARWRIGNRLYASIDVTNGFYPRKLTLPLAAKFEDGSALAARLMGANVGDKLRALPPELGVSARWRIGQRLYASLNPAQGFYPRKLTMPASAVIDDQPGVKLVDRLGGANRAASINANFIAMAGLDANGKSQISTRRRSDSARFQITTGLSSYRFPILTPDDKVLFDSDADGRMMYAPATGGAIWPVDPYDILDCYGDSLTAGAGANGAGAKQGPYPKQLADRLGSVVAAVNNRGIGGQISADIVARQGGTPALISVTDNLIPASGGVVVTSYSQDLLYNSGISGSATLTGTLAGVPGTLSGNSVSGRNASTYTFTRSSPGAAVPCPANTPFIPDFGVASRPRVQIYQYGRNDGTNATATAAILNALAASVAYQTAYQPRFLVGGTIATVGEALAGFNTLRDTLAATYPGRFVDINAAPTAEEMFTLGFVPDSYGAYSNGRTDAQDLAAGYIPSGMRNGATTGNGDFLHLNNFGYGLLALRYYRAIVAKGWWPSLPIV